MAVGSDQHSASKIFKQHKSDLKDGLSGLRWQLKRHHSVIHSFVDDYLEVLCARTVSIPFFYLYAVNRGSVIVISCMYMCFSHSPVLELVWFILICQICYHTAVNGLMKFNSNALTLVSTISQKHLEGISTSSSKKLKLQLITWSEVESQVCFDL